MIYRFRKDLENDDYAYHIMSEKLNELLKEAGIPTEAATELRSRNGLIALKPYPFKGFAEETKKLKKIPGIMRVKKGRMQWGETTIITINAHCNGLEMLRQIMKPEDEIVFYEEEKMENKNKEKIERVDLGV